MDLPVRWSGIFNPKKFSMHFIVFDLEATCWQDDLFQKESEIIEIGAYKVDNYGEVLSAFQSFVKPIIHPILSSYCKHLTTIEQVQINKAPKFEVVIQKFQNWVDLYGEPYQLCAWGKFDQLLLQQDCHLHRLEADWLEDYIDVKKQYHNIRRLNKVEGMMKTLVKEGFEFEGTPHRAIDDAQNLLKIFIRHIDDWRF